VPAPAQAPRGRDRASADAELVAAIRSIDDLPSRQAVDAERAVLVTLEPAVSAPIVPLP
jgi:hydroxymethylbilane synthase